MRDELWSMTQCAEYGKLTRQAIYNAIKANRLKAVKVSGKWRVSKADFDGYRLTKYSREFRQIDGELVFSVDKGHFSVLQVSKAISHHLGRPYPQQRIYYLLRMGKLKAMRKGVAWVIMREDAEELLQKEMVRMGSKTLLRRHG
jgi:excisionase family DNA binding protein